MGQIECLLKVLLIIRCIHEEVDLEFCDAFANGRDLV